jgi:hypothetical protein
MVYEIYMKRTINVMTQQFFTGMHNWSHLVVE